MDRLAYRNFSSIYSLEMKCMLFRIVHDGSKILLHARKSKGNINRSAEEMILQRIEKDNGTTQKSQ
jgi:hypothetical protein